MEYFVCIFIMIVFDFWISKIWQKQLVFERLPLISSIKNVQYQYE